MPINSKLEGLSQLQDVVQPRCLSLNKWADDSVLSYKNGEPEDGQAVRYVAPYNFFIF